MTLWGGLRRISSMCTRCRDFSHATGDGTPGWSNAVALHLMQKKCDLIRFELCRVSGRVWMPSLNTFGGRNKCFKNFTHEGMGTNG